MSVINPRVSQRQKKAESALGPYVKRMMMEFGTDKHRVDFTVEVENSLDRYKLQARDNLFAIVMPVGSGKTSVCDRYGFVDIDRCAVKIEHDTLNEMRVDCINGKQSWEEHNKYWLRLVNQTLDLVDYSRPVVIMVHSEIIALNIGALPLVGMCPDDKLFKDIYNGMVAKKNIKRAELSALNRAEFQSHSNILMRSKRTFGSYDELDRLIIRTMLVNDLPVAQPYKYSRLVKSSYYHDSCPDWVLTGDKGKVDPGVLIRLIDANHAPKEAGDFFLKTNDIPASFGFGIRMNEWASTLAEIRYATTDCRDFDTGGDMGEIFPYDSMKMKTRSNITMQRLVKGLDVFDDDIIYSVATHHVGRPNNFVTALICYIIGILKNCDTGHLAIKMMGVSFPRWTEVFKEFHANIRLSRYFMNTVISESERQKLMYIHLLVGKEEGVADWVAEVEDRTCDDPSPDHKAYNKELGTWTRTQYYKDFKEALENVHCKFGGYKNRSIQSFKDFYDLRYTWLTKGSLTYNNLDPDIKKYVIGIWDEVNGIVRQAEGRHNKKSIFEVFHILQELDTPFELFNVTKIVTKLDECGHTKRALFPGSLLHYVIFSYVLTIAEMQGQVGNVRLNADPDEDMPYIEMKLSSTIPRLLFDWVNYNSYHSQDEMALVIEKLAQKITEPGDYYSFCMCISRAMYHMSFQDPDGGKHQLGRGLYSGWRGTSYINTVLNATYVECGAISYRRLYDQDPFRYIDGGGDDLDAGMNNPNQAYKLLSVMRKMNFKAKDIKQMIDYKSEFFRNTISGEGAYASPTRALATFINGKWEGHGNIPIKDRITAILDQVGKIVRRGFDAGFGNTLSVLCLSHWCKVGDNDDWLSLPAEVLHGDMKCGGLGIPDGDGMLWELEDIVPEPAQKTEVMNVPGTLASHDYLSVLCKELKQFGMEVEDSRSLEVEMAKASFDIYQEYDYSNIIKFKSRVVSKRLVVEPRRNEAVFAAFSRFTGVYTGDRDLTKMLRFDSILPYIRLNGKKMNREQLMEVMEVSVNRNVFDFSGDLYYRRLVSESVAKVVTDFCLHATAREDIPLEISQEWFKDLCYMCWEDFEIRL